MFVGLQTWLLRSAGAVAQPASAIYVAIFNAAIGTGAFVGGQLIASAGLSGMVWLAAGIMVGSTLLIALLKAPLPGQVSAADGRRLDLRQPAVDIDLRGVNKARLIRR
ncbi:putative integral membrane transport protein [Klebsiella pneumoniae subsp. pneumoniae]|nr:putative integral membrane transport protein [Klebsiella pneumoniae subsp. pneumoniae]